MPVHNKHVSEPEPPQTSRAAHGRRRARIWVWVGTVTAAVVLFGGAVVVMTALGVPVLGIGGAHGVSPARSESPAVRAPTASGLPVPEQTSTAMAPTAPCDDPAVTAALQGGTDAEAIAAVGGAEAFRLAVVNGIAPCVSLSEANRVWVVVNKQRALEPIDYWPEPQARADGVQRTSGGHMRADVADALEQLAWASEAEGAGAVGVDSGFRSYTMQQSNYAGNVGTLGYDDADLISARPGHSEHQSGLAVDLVACSRGCGTLEQFGGTPQATWLAANAWRFGFIVRYEQGMTAVTGYDWEPWHLRYIGVELAQAYHDGGHHSLEQFFGLPAAPGYPG